VLWDEAFAALTWVSTMISLKGVIIVSNFLHRDFLNFIIVEMYPSQHLNQITLG